MIIVDTRELDFIKNCKFPISTEQLDLGDIIIKNELLVPIVVIERKTVSDFVASIKDSRYHEQKARLLGCYGNIKIIYIIEGLTLTSGKINGIPIDTLYSSLIGLTIRDGITLFQTNNILETIKLVEMISKKLDKLKIEIDKDYIETLKLKKKDNKNENDAMIFILCQVPSVGINVAKAIKDKYNSIMNLVCEFKTSNDPNMLSDMIINGRKINKNISSNIFNYFSK